jgi:hypothetical protein
MDFNDEYDQPNSVNGPVGLALRLVCKPKAEPALFSHAHQKCHRIQWEQARRRTVACTVTLLVSLRDFPFACALPVLLHTLSTSAKDAL